MKNSRTNMLIAAAFLAISGCVTERSRNTAADAADTVPKSSIPPVSTAESISATATFRCGLPRHLQCADSVYLTFFDKTAAGLAQGYRLPGPPDFGATWSAYASFIYKTTDDSDSTKAPYWTKGDFNNDGATDFAYILIRSADSAMVLVAIVSNAGSYRMITLDDDIDQEMGLATQGRGTFTTASGKGYWDTTPEDPGTVRIAKHAIAFLMFEGAASLFVWDPSKQAFVRVWMSD